MLAFIFLLITSLFYTVPSVADVNNAADSLKRNRPTIAQDTVKSRYLYIDNIIIIGNKITKQRMIEREVSVRKGERYNEQDLNLILKADKNKIFNTRLFNTVDISLLELGNDVVDIIIKVTERWYTFPVPIFDLVDRNFNDWWQNQNHDLSRINYGLTLYQYNVRGRGEKLKAQVQFGYTKQFEGAYSIPYIDKGQRHGLSIRYRYSENKNIPYRTVEHKREFLDSENVLRTERLFSLGYTFRNSFYSTHYLYLQYNDNDIEDQVAQENPNFYLNGRTRQKYISLVYEFNLDRRNNVSYPLSGYKFNFYIDKYGIGLYNDLDQTDAGIKYSHFFDLHKGFYLSNYTSVYASTPKRQPYANLVGLGYKSDFIRGYELYVVEGKSYYLNRTTIKKRLFQTVSHMNFIPIDQFKNIPIAIYLKSYLDLGYAENFQHYDFNTSFSDELIYGTGVGIDIVTYYDTVLRFEYSMNKEKESGLFIHFRKEF